MNRRTFCRLALTAPALLPSLARSATVESEVIDRAVQQAMRHWKVPGCSLVIVSPDKTLHLKGYGLKDIGRRTPVTADTLFPLGSCTKAFTTAALGILVDEGKLHWDDHVRKHLPYFRLSDPLADKAVRLRDLLCHRTGVAPHEMLWYRAAWSQEEAIRRLAHLPLAQPFRTAFQYQTTMYTAAGFALAAAAQVSWAEFVQQRLLTPLEMRATSLTTTAAEKVRDRATGHHHHGDDEVHTIADWYPMETPEPAGSLNSTARDLAAWLRLHLRQGRVGERQLISAQSLGETHTPQIHMRLEGITAELEPETDQMSYGMGWVIQDYRGRLMLTHAGAIDGFRAHLVIMPRDGIALALLNNLHQSRMNHALGNRLIDLLLGLKQRDWNTLLSTIAHKEQAKAQEDHQRFLASRKRNTTPSHSANAYLGRYVHPAYGTMRLGVEHGQLHWSWSSFRGLLHHFHYDTFVAQNEYLGEPLCTFHLGTEGNVTSMTWGPPLGVTFTRVRRKQ